MTILNPASFRSTQRVNPELGPELYTAYDMIWK